MKACNSNTHFCGWRGPYWASWILRVRDLKCIMHSLCIKFLWVLTKSYIHTYIHRFEAFFSLLLYRKEKTNCTWHWWLTNEYVCASKGILIVYLHPEISIISRYSNIYISIVDEYLKFKGGDVTFWTIKRIPGYYNHQLQSSPLQLMARKYIHEHVNWKF